MLWFYGFFLKSKKNKVLQIFCEENRTKSHLLRLMEIFSVWKRSDLFVPTLFRDIDIVDFRMMQNWYHVSRAFQKTTWRPPSVNFSWLGVSRKNEQTESTRSKSKQWFLWISQRWGSFIYCFHAWLHLLTRLSISKLKANTRSIIDYIPNIAVIFFGCSGFQTAKGTFGWQERITQK